MQTIYFHNCFSPYRGLAANNDRMHHHNTTWIPFLIQISPFCFHSKNGEGVQNDSSWKTATTI